MTELKSFRVWDAPTRWFHWINAICVVALVVVGYIILKGGALEIQPAGKLKLKSIHSWIGYVFVINLLVRIAWAWLGNRYARWRAILPGGRGFLAALGSYIKAVFSRQPQHYLGHNPLGRISIATMLLLLFILAVSGLVLAGTDLFWPPLGGWVAGWIAPLGVAPGTLVPGSPDMYDKAAFSSMRAFRKPFILSHLYSFYAILAIGGLHILGVVVTEIREGGSTISATFTGTKILDGRPIDEEPASNG